MTPTPLPQDLLGHLLGHHRRHHQAHQARQALHHLHLPPTMRIPRVDASLTKLM